MQYFDVAAFRSLPLPDEREIMSGWRGDADLPIVSVICTTYNHEAYVEDAIRGFLLQRTNFPFEVVIHDDASTDTTQSIIRRYAAQYPRLIRPVLQFENQFSKGRKPVPLAQSHARGDYLALCEGDDFWVHPDKLAMQYAALLAYPECNICFHLAWHGGSDASPDLFERPRNNRLLYPAVSCVLPAKVIIAGAGNFVPTASIFMKKFVMETLPSWFDDCPVGDYFIQVLGATPAGAVFFPMQMCCYRVEAAGSWSQGQNAMQQKKVRHWVLMRRSIGVMEEFLGDNWRSDVRFVQRNADEFFMGDRSLPVDVRVKAFLEYAKSSRGICIRLLMAVRHIPGVMKLLLLLPYKARLARLLYLGRIKVMKDIAGIIRSTEGGLV